MLHGTQLGCDFGNTRGKPLGGIHAYVHVERIVVKCVSFTVLEQRTRSAGSREGGRQVGILLFRGASELIEERKIEVSTINFRTEYKRKNDNNRYIRGS